MPMMGVFELRNAKIILFGLWGDAPNSNTTVPQRPAKLFLHTSLMGVFELHNAEKNLFGFWGGTPNTNTSVLQRPAKVFLDTEDGGF